jgi:hypothetical protein
MERDSLSRAIEAMRSCKEQIGIEHNGEQYGPVSARSIAHDENRRP